MSVPSVDLGGDATTPTLTGAQLTALRTLQAARSRGVRNPTIVSEKIREALNALTPKEKQ
jgi:hypothetical protein